MHPATEQPATPRVRNPDAIVPLGSTSSEVDAHLLADALRRAGIEARAIDAHAGGALPFASVFPASILVRAADYEDARGFIEQLRFDEPDTAIPPRCPVCRYDTGGLGEDAVCPECGAPLARMARLHRQFRLAPPPGSGAGAQRVGALIGLLAIVLMAGGLLVAIAYAVVTGWGGAP